MAKIHTHYDNLKVARLAPQEVIRAAYKALSQKYHPDKNPGDEKAARIMAILNSAYGILSDPVRRKEHDEWIAAEEWEIEWLESTHDDGSKHREPAWEPRPVEPHTLYRFRRDWRVWFALAGTFALGCVAGLFIMQQPRIASGAWASSVFGANAVARTAETKVDVKAEAKTPPELRGDPILDSWAVSKASAPDSAQPPDIKALAVTQLMVPARPPDCDTELHTLVAPNGEPWPTVSGYVDGFPVGNKGDEMQVAINNSTNSSAVFIKLYDLDRRSNVRHAYVLPHESLTIDKLAAGKYEVRYQNVDVGGSKAECQARKKRVVRGSVEPQS